MGTWPIFLGVHSLFYLRGFDHLITQGGHIVVGNIPWFFFPTGPSEAYNVETRRNSTGSKKVFWLFLNSWLINTGIIVLTCATFLYQGNCLCPVASSVYYFNWWTNAVSFQKKRCKMKSSRKPETITPTLLSTRSIPNGGLQCNHQHPHNLNLKLPPCSPSPPSFSFRDSPSEGSSEDSSQSDEASFCGFTSCARLCDPLPAPKSHSKKKNRLKKRSTILKQLLKTVECNGPPVAPKFTLHGLITGSSEQRTNRPGDPLLPGKNSFDCQC